MADSATRSAAPRRTAQGMGTVLLTVTGLAAAFGVASCCALPFFLATAGLGTAWLTGVALVSEPHRVLLLGISAICLVAGGVLLWRQGRATVCAPGGICSRPGVRGLTAMGLLIGLVLLYLGYSYV